jgi:hypothetical protein
MTSAQRTAISSPATGLIVYQTDGTDGFYYYDGSAWVLLINGTDALPAVNGSAVTNLNASNLASGTVPTARMGSGTASSSTFLRGDGTWNSPVIGNMTCSSISANTTITTDNQFVYVTGNYEVKLPASPATGQVVYLYTDNTNATVNPNGKSIRQANADWSTSKFSEFGNAATYGLILFYNGTKWFPMSWN